MRVITYNILNGGEGRADPLAEVIEAQRADVVVLVEADNQDVIERIAGRLKMDYITGPGGRHAGAILSRFTIRTTINHALLGEVPINSFLEAHVVDPAGVEWPIVAIHLKARASEEREQIRERQIEMILKRLKRLHGRPHILAGDFNANSPIQQIDIAKCKPRTQEEFKENGGVIPRRAIQRLLDAGYTDTLFAAAPESARTLGTSDTQHPGQRIDYIFTHGFAASKIKAAWIETDRLAKYASDHFPIGADIESA